MHVWVVEMLDTDEWGKSTGKWWACRGLGLTKYAAREELAYWRKRDPGFRYRIRKYVPAGGKR